MVLYIPSVFLINCRISDSIQQFSTEARSFSEGPFHKGSRLKQLEGFRKTSSISVPKILEKKMPKIFEVYFWFKDYNHLYI